MSTFYDYLIEDIDDVKDAEKADKEAEKAAVGELEPSAFKDNVEFTEIQKLVDKATQAPDWDCSKYLRQLKKLMLNVKATRGFSSLAWWKRLQYFYNAYIAESAIVAACAELPEVTYYDVKHPNTKNHAVDANHNSHTAISTKNKAEDTPDLVFTKDDGTEGKLEVKIYANDASIKNYSASAYHDADYVVIYNLSTKDIVFKEKDANGNYVEKTSFEDKAMNDIATKIKSKTADIFYDFIKLVPDNKKIKDYKFIKIQKMNGEKPVEPNENEEN